MTLKKIDLFTNSPIIIPILSSKYSINKIFTEKKEIFKLAKKLKFNVTLIKSYKDLIKINLSNSNIGISYGFGIIFKTKFIKKYREGIWNVHPGDLPSYRGRHPITAAFLNNEKKIGLSIHIINDKIDQGILLEKYFVKRTYQDDEPSIEKKLFKNFIKHLKKAENNYKNKKTSKLLKGKYHRPFLNGISIKNSKKVNYIYIYNATKAQKSYGGLTVNNKKFIDCYFYKKNLSKKNSEIVTCKNNKKLIMIFK